MYFIVAFPLMIIFQFVGLEIYFTFEFEFCFCPSLVYNRTLSLHETPKLEFEIGLEKGKIAS